MPDFSLSKALDSAAGKAIVPHPALMDRTTPMSTYQPGRGGSSRGLTSQRQAMRHSSAYGGEQAIDWVYDAINLYSDAAASAEYRLEKPDGTQLVRFKTDGTSPDAEQGPEALYRLFDKPNPFMLYSELVRLLVIDLLLVGNGYWYKWQTDDAGQPLALYRLAPSYVKIKTDPAGPVGYEYQPPGAKEPLVINPEDVIHFRRPNPHSAWYGMGVIQGAGRAMDLELSITDTMASYYENRAEPSLIIQSERRVPREVFNKLRTQLRARAGGSARAGEILVLEAGLEASTLSSTAATALFEELSTLSQQRIYAKFRAHPALFGQPSSNQGNDKVADIRREFDNSALRPFLVFLAETITAGLAESFGCKFVIEHRSTFPADELVKVVGMLAALPGIKIREIRAQLKQLGISESTGDSTIDNFVLNLPGPQADENGNIIDPVTGKKVAVADAGSADRNLPGEAGRPPNGENTSGFGSAGGKSIEDLLEELKERADG